MKDLEERIGYSFRDPELLRTALTHSSFLNEHGLPRTACNERLEFLGDAILETAVSRYLFRIFPDSMEGDLSKRRAVLVCEESLAKAAEALSLGEYLILGKGLSENGGRTSPAILSDAFEALLAAIDLDGGSVFALRLIEELVLKKQETAITDPKTVLQELAQKHGKTVSYRLLEETGPEHDKTFTYEVLINGTPFGKGTGRSKKAAQAEAARKTMELTGKTTCI